MEKSASIQNLAKALILFNGLVSKVKKGSDNPFFKSKYAALPDVLAAIHAPLLEAGLTINQFPTGLHGLTTILIHAESGEYMMDTYTMTPTKNDPQGIGSCITYQRRYAVGAVLSLNIDEDDDGNKASQPAKKAEPPKDYSGEIIEAIAKLKNCTSKDELTTFKSSLPAPVTHSEAFKKAGLIRFNEINVVNPQLV